MKYMKVVLVSLIAPLVADAYLTVEAFTTGDNTCLILAVLAWCAVSTAMILITLAFYKDFLMKKMDQISERQTQFIEFEYNSKLAIEAAEKRAQNAEERAQKAAEQTVEYYRQNIEANKRMRSLLKQIGKDDRKEDQK